MFTGIVETTARILTVTHSSLRIERPSCFDDLTIGASIAVMGACLSVTTFDDASITFDVIPTTYEKTTLGHLQPGELVNLERSLRADGRFHGHIVTGHIASTAPVQSIVIHDQEATITIDTMPAWRPAIVPQGSIAIDGVSLTVARTTECTCTVALIPQTLMTTTLGSLTSGKHVNIEPDILATYVQHVRA